MWIFEQQQCLRQGKPVLESLQVCHVPVGKHLVGRNKNDTDLSIVIDDRGVSKKHCSITVTEDGICEICDLASTLGTAVNNQLIGTTVVLKDNDVVRFGNKHGKADFAARKLPISVYCGGDEDRDVSKKIGFRIVDEFYEWPTHVVTSTPSPWILRCSLAGAEAVEASWLREIATRQHLSDPLPAVADHLSDIPTGAEIRRNASKAFAGRAAICEAENSSSQIGLLAREVTDQVYATVDDVPESIKLVACLHPHEDFPVVDLVEHLVRGTPIEAVPRVVHSRQEEEDDDRTCDSDEEEEVVVPSRPKETGWIFQGGEEAKNEEIPREEGASAHVAVAAGGREKFVDKPEKPADTLDKDDLVIVVENDSRSRRDFRKFKKNYVDRSATEVFVDLVAVQPMETQASRKMARLEEEEKRKRREENAIFEDAPAPPPKKQRRKR